MKKALSVFLVLAAASAQARVGIPRKIECTSASKSMKNRIVVDKVVKKDSRNFYGDVTLDYEGTHKKFRKRSFGFRYESDAVHYVSFLTPLGNKPEFLFGIDAAQQDNEKEWITRNLVEGLKLQGLGEPGFEGQVDASGQLTLNAARARDSGVLDLFVCKLR